ncbi:hypothetical protein [Nitrospira sp. Nam80]
MRVRARASRIRVFLGFLCCAFLLSPAPGWPAPAQGSLIDLEIRYELPAAGEVLFVWGVNGWLPVSDHIRPPGTVMRKQVMATPMILKEKSFTVILRVEKEATVNYGFLITKTAGGAPVDVWDGDDSYHATPTRSEVLSVQSVKLYQNWPILIDTAGAIFAAVLAVLFAGLLTLSGWLMWSQPEPAVADNSPTESDARFAAVVSMTAFLIGLVVILHHEMWRDELQAWSIAASSQTLSELLGNARYEGHPPLWYLCLYILSRFSNNPLLMQLFHLMVGVAAVFVLCRHAPFTRLQKICLSFGYFPFYEYLIVSRNYALGVLALCAFCAVQTKSPGRLLTSALLLAIMINTSAFGAIIAVALGGWLLVEGFACRQRTSPALILGVVCVLGLGLAVAGMQSTPPPDNSPRMLAWNTILLGSPLEKTVSAIWRSFVPLPLNLPHFWNSNLLDEMPAIRLGQLVLEPRDVQSLLAVGLFGIAAVLLARTPSVMLLYVVATGGLLLFLHLKVNHGIRHTGHVFLIFVGCLWLSLARKQWQGIERITGRADMAFVTMLFAGHTVAGGLAAATDLVYPFSASKETAEFIERRGLMGTTMVGSKFDLASAVAGYLNHPMYYVENKQTGTFIRWQDKRTRATPEEVVRQATDLARVNHDNVVMILSYDLGSAGVRTLELASFQRSILKEERYWVYLMPYSERHAAREVGHDGQ